MSFVITKECFSPAQGCHNCQRKSRHVIGEKTEEMKDFQRCSGCHLLTYCDKQCQAEHWEKVHKSHCRFLSGRKQVKNSRHREETCAMCIDEKQTCDNDLVNIKSPKTDCHIDGVIHNMKIGLGEFFGFHGEGKICDCSLKFGCELPYPVGEVSGQFTDAIDGMFAHALKIMNALRIKTNNPGKKETLANVDKTFYALRAARWRNILVYGVPNCLDDQGETRIKSLSDPVKGLKVHSGPINVWWKALMFTVENIENMNVDLASDFMDGNSIQDPVYGTMKLVYDYKELQLRNQVLVSENNLWAKFKLWPRLSGNSLVIVLPDETKCQACDSPLTGEFTIMNDFDTSLPILMPRIGEHGKLVVCCPVLQTRRCLRDHFTKDKMAEIQTDKEKQKNYREECKIFLNKGRYCDMCLKMSIFSHRCSECHAAQYCSTQCQGKDLKFHKTVCSTWAKDQSKKVISSKQQKKMYKSKLKELPK